MKLNIAPIISSLQINEDLEGEVHFATAVGPFYVPVRCTIKKCDVSNVPSPTQCPFQMITTVCYSWQPFTASDYYCF